MRVSEKMKMSTMLYDLNRSMRGMLKKQTDLATSKRIHRPSDDPSGTAKLMRLKDDLMKYDGYEKNVDDGERWVSATELVINDASAIMDEVSSLMLQAVNDTSGEDVRETLAGRMRGLWEMAASLANRQLNDKYLFGGTNTDHIPIQSLSTVAGESVIPSFSEDAALNSTNLAEGSVRISSADGSVIYTEDTDYTVDREDGMITFLDTGSIIEGDEVLVDYETEDATLFETNSQGTEGTILREMGDDVILQVNVNADEVFSGESGILNIIKGAINALERNSREDIVLARNRATDTQNQIIQLQGQLGVRINRLEDQREHIKAARFNLEEVISQIEDTDVTTTLMQLQQDQVVYQTALKTSAQLMQISLLDYM